MLNTMDAAAPQSRPFALTLHRATALVDRVADVYLRPAHGIGVADFAALITIDAFAPARQSSIARGMGVSRAAVTQRLAELVGKGLVQVSPDPSNARANLVSLTGSGSRLLASAWAGLDASDDGLEDSIDLALLQQQLETLIANAERHLAARAEASDGSAGGRR
ncbi:MarR family winged helix-turn-helix transcriptional regulator [Agromyces sp. LHK192]|uniref:MarR family winged helix-turn-helix transcriptional regulator n=1 Tax=Agromyces sp. LHK192 TaxID=2498704 RepID=UPI000FD782F5|nr:MarR family winged helix-turn-helix transcriptional regulator [Agromyces sp. LHK192]